MHDLALSLLMLAALALAPWVANATASRAVSRFRANDEARVD